MAFLRKLHTQSTDRIAVQDHCSVIYEVDTLSSSVGKKKAAAISMNENSDSHATTTNFASKQTIAKPVNRSIYILGEQIGPSGSGNLVNTLHYVGTPPSSRIKASLTLRKKDVGKPAAVTLIATKQLASLITGEPGTELRNLPTVCETDFAAELILLDAAGLNVDASIHESSAGKRKRKSPISTKHRSTSPQLDLRVRSESPQDPIQFREALIASAAGKRVNFASSEYLNGYLEVSPVGVGRSTVEFRESLRKFGIDRKAAAVLKVWYNLIWL